MSGAAYAESGKRVSWVELYLDLVFVLAVAQLAHLMVAEPETHSVWTALGLFITLWWTWIGFTVLYNRRGDDDVSSRLLFLVASVPVGIAAVAIEPASNGDVAVFALAMAAVRVVLAFGFAAGSKDLLNLRSSRAYLMSAVLFVISAVSPRWLRFAMWVVAIASESRPLLNEDREAMHRLRRERDFAAAAPDDPREALDAHHFAERFGLFLIILIGEVVVEAGQTSAAAHVDTTGGWAALGAAMVLAAALWWLYFDAAAEINLEVLKLSGGSTSIARAIFAVGHMLPAFGLIVCAAGIGLLLEADPPDIAPWFACVGAGIYLAGTRGFQRRARTGRSVVRILLVVATFFLGRLEPAFGPRGFLWLLTAWMVACAALAYYDGRAALSAATSRAQG